MRLLIYLGHSFTVHPVQENPVCTFNQIKPYLDRSMHRDTQAAGNGYPHSESVLKWILSLSILLEPLSGTSLVGFLLTNW